MTTAAAVVAELEALEAEQAKREALKRANRWCPQTPTPRQAQFLALDAEEALFGGAAGPGKSSALLMDVLEGAEIPGFAALVIRRTFPELALPGAIMDRAGDWLRPTAARWNGERKRWTFPSGASLTFGYLETKADLGRYQGPEFNRIAFDELTQFPEAHYLWLTSRLRRPSDFPLRPHIRSASNPGGRGHGWVYSRFVDPETAQFPFVPARLEDNPHIDQADYRGKLERLDATTRAQLLDGEWIEDRQGLIYPHTAANLCDPLSWMAEEGWHFVLGVDLGSSEEKPTTAFCVLGWHRKVPEGVWVLESHARAGMIPSTIAEEIIRLGKAYGGFVSTVIDEGALGKGYGSEFRQRWTIAAEPAEKGGKLGFRKLLRGALEQGHIQIVDVLNEELIAEMRAVRWNEDGTDNEKGVANHLTDALLYGWRAARAFTSRTPRHRPAPGTAEAYTAEMESIEDKEDREGLRNRKRSARRPWWKK